MPSTSTTHVHHANLPPPNHSMTAQVFAVPVFFVVFRETIETVIVVSVLLAFLKQTLDGPQRDMRTYKKLVKQVCLCSGMRLVICSHFQGLAGSCSWPPDLSDCRCWHHCGLLYQGQRRMDSHRVLLGRVLRFDCCCYHRTSGCCSPSGFQVAGQMACQARYGTGVAANHQRWS